MTGTIGDIGCFSLHPLKNLHVYGDGGLISTNDEKIYTALQLLRNHGLINRDNCSHWGLNSRLDALQAGIGLVGLKYIEEWNNNRRHIANIYQTKLKDKLDVPIDKIDEHAVYHNFVVQTDKRDDLLQFLSQQGIETKIHYPIPIHLQPASTALGYKKGDFPIAEKLAKSMLSLPIYSEIGRDEQEDVIEAILTFFKD
jgi:dTDP-4-amino-4,6-dideoxygalactose transaminase